MAFQNPRCRGARLIAPAFILAALHFLDCTYPADSSGRDLLEIERVWQYLKAYSIYSSQLQSLEQALGADSPDAVVAGLRADTLYSHWEDTTYTVAGYSPYCAISQGVAGNADYIADRSAQALSEHGTVRVEPLTKNTAYIAIDSFMTGTDDTLRALGNGLAAFPNIILDLRYNPGGSLDACTASIELFLPADVAYLYASYRKDVLSEGDTGTVLNDLWSSGTTGDAYEGKRTVILMGPYTASAAEIMVVALRDALGSNMVTTIGRRSYGKSIGQFRFCFWGSSGGQLVLTGFRFLPLGGQARDYHERGIIPDAADSADSLLPLVIGAGELLEPGFEQRLPTVVRARLRSLAKLPPIPAPSCYREVTATRFPLF